MKTELNIILIDDELGALEALKSIINLTAPEFRIIGTANTVDEGFKLIQRLKPDLVFLDIQLKKQTGFDLLEMPFDCEFEVVFVTAYDEYAIKAFEKNALSYLLKPLSVDQFKRVKERIIRIVSSSKSEINIDKILNGKLAIPNGSVVDYVDPSDILYIKADGSYSEVYTLHGSKILISKSLGMLEPKLNTSEFFRPHRSFIVNHHHVMRWNKSDGGWLVMKNFHEIPISKGGRDLVEKHLS
ncbi:MAG: LytTR family DNA-binding domain-containing protein [Flavobacteriales bacterium]